MKKALIGWIVMVVVISSSIFIYHSFNKSNNTQEILQANREVDNLLTKYVPSKNPLLYRKIVGDGLTYELYNTNKERALEIVKSSKILANTIGSINNIDYIESLNTIILGNLDYDMYGENSQSNHTDLRASALEEMGYNEEQIESILNNYNILQNIYMNADKNL